MVEAGSSPLGVGETPSDMAAGVKPSYCIAVFLLGGVVASGLVGAWRLSLLPVVLLAALLAVDVAATFFQRPGSGGERIAQISPTCRD